MAIDIIFDHLNDAFNAAFGLDIGKNLYISLRGDKWHLTNWGGVQHPCIFLNIDAGATYDKRWIDDKAKE